MDHAVYKKVVSLYTWVAGYVQVVVIREVVLINVSIRGAFKGGGGAFAPPLKL